MEPVQILAQVNTEEGVPSNWIVFPLQRQNVLVGIVGWVFGTFAGGLMFFFMAPIMIPHNYQQSAFSAILSTIILGVVLFVGLGSLWAMISDIIRVREADKHVIIITPEEFVKQEGKKILHVPLEYVKHVTARGAPPVDRNAPSADDMRPGSVSEGIGSLFLGRRVASGGRQGIFGRRRVRTPTTVAFIDSRTDTEVIVVTDKAYGEPHYIANSLKECIQNVVVVK